jgi:hypothetical protein
MSENSSIRILTDGFLNIEKKSAMSLPDLDIVIGCPIDVNIETIKNELKKTLTNVFEILEDIPLESKNFKIAEIDFTLSIDTKGEISLVSVVKSSVSGQTGINLKILRREKNNGKE